MKKRLRISFGSEEEIERLRKNTKFKLNVRNNLGVRHQDDWIFNLNIGNVMHLSSMNLEELSTKIDTTHELNRDAMLEKVVLLSVAYFCIATELRFISNKDSNMDDSKKERLVRESEFWHNKSVRAGCHYLPS
jgi:hypothetical protein